MARLRFFKLERGKVDAVLGMDRALASHAPPTADRDVDIKRVDLDAPADAAGALRRHQGRSRQKRIDVAGRSHCPFIAKCLCHLPHCDQDTRLGYIREQPVFTATVRGLFQATASGIRWFSTRYPGFSEPSSVLLCARKFLWDQDRSKILGPSQAR